MVVSAPVDQRFSVVLGASLVTGSGLASRSSAWKWKPISETFIAAGALIDAAKMGCSYLIVLFLGTLCFGWARGQEPETVPTDPDACPTGMEFRTCGTACPPACDQPAFRPCTLQCVRGELHVPSASYPHAAFLASIPASYLMQ